MLDGIARVLRPGGRLAVDLDNLTTFLASYCPSRVVAARDDGDMLVNRYHLDALTGRFEAERTVIRSGRTRRVNFVKRLFGFPELRDWLLAAGFTAVTGYGEDGRALTAEHKRMIIVADLAAGRPEHRRGAGHWPALRAAGVERGRGVRGGRRAGRPPGWTATAPPGRRCGPPRRSPARRR